MRCNHVILMKIIDESVVVTKRLINLLNKSGLKQNCENAFQFMPFDFKTESELEKFKIRSRGTKFDHFD